MSLFLGEGGSKFITMRPGESTNVSLLLYNLGETDQFVVTERSEIMGRDRKNKDSNFFKCHWSPRSVSLVQNASTQIEMQIFVSENACDGMAVTFTVNAESIKNSAINNFIEVEIITTTNALPRFMNAVRINIIFT